MFNIPIVVQDQDQVGGVHVAVVDELGGEEGSEPQQVDGVNKASHSKSSTYRARLLMRTLLEFKLLAGKEM